MDRDQLSQRFIEVLTPHMEADFIMPVKGWQVGFLHGMIALAMTHPDMKKLGNVEAFGQQVRDWCKQTFLSMGFTSEEVEMLDKLREEAGDDRWGTKDNDPM